MKYFEYKEFDSPDVWGSGEVNMDRAFLKLLGQCREKAGIPFFINSGFRTVYHNKEVGGRETSAHLTGHAADIACTNSGDRERIVKAAVELGFRRIGIANSFVHLDNDPTKKPALWLY